MKSIVIYRKYIYRRECELIVLLTIWQLGVTVIVDTAQSCRRIASLNRAE